LVAVAAVASVSTIQILKRVHMPTRAIVLGGGGVTGIAWELGVLSGLASNGVELRADAVFGTSAGAFVGVALAGGVDLEGAFAAQHQPAPDESAVTVPRSLMLAWVLAYLRGYGRPARIGAGFGRIARRRSPLNDPEQRRRAVESRLQTTQWPPTLRVTALNAQTGELRAFGPSDGHPLVDAVAASGAVPGISPPVDLENQTWIDGGMVSSANARVAEGYDEILVLAPLPRSYGGVPSARDDVEHLSAHATVQLIVPDQDSQAAIGPNIYDPSRRPAAADAGRAQGECTATQLPWSP
jgi:NTE family protein